MCRKMTKAAPAGDPMVNRSNQLLQYKYQTGSGLSTKKISKTFLGEALLFGNRESKKFWPAFEVLLRRAI